MSFANITNNEVYKNVFSSEALFYLLMIILTLIIFGSFKILHICNIIYIVLKIKRVVKYLTTLFYANNSEEYILVYPKDTRLNPVT